MQFGIQGSLEQHGFARSMFCIFFFLNIYIKEKEINNISVDF
jgi:hypothetical protein